MVASPLIISIKEARKVLGKSAKHLSDEQIVTIIVLLTDISFQYIKNKSSNK